MILLFGKNKMSSDVRGGELAGALDVWSFFFFYKKNLICTIHHAEH